MTAGRAPTRRSFGNPPIINGGITKLLHAAYSTGKQQVIDDALNRVTTARRMISNGMMDLIADRDSSDGYCQVCIDEGMIFDLATVVKIGTIELM